jgi:hypothetical protein
MMRPKRIWVTVAGLLAPGGADDKQDLFRRTLEIDCDSKSEILPGNSSKSNGILFGLYRSVNNSMIMIDPAH